ncbi:hypothetical protein C7405_112106 [Paraburkholderia caballeronis]|nr:hypothetical protein C7405_112106 [Paraburkholderia caballeronis]
MRRRERLVRCEIDRVSRGVVRQRRLTGLRKLHDVGLPCQGRRRQRVRERQRIVRRDRIQRFGRTCRFDGSNWFDIERSRWRSGGLIVIEQDPRREAVFGSGPSIARTGTPGCTVVVTHGLNGGGRLRSERRFRQGRGSFSQGGRSIGGRIRRDRRNRAHNIGRTVIDRDGVRADRVGRRSPIDRAVLQRRLRIAHPGTPRGICAGECRPPRGVLLDRAQRRRDVFRRRRPWRLVVRRRRQSGNRRRAGAARSHWRGARRLRMRRRLRTTRRPDIRPRRFDRPRCRRGRGGARRGAAGYRRRTAATARRRAERLRVAGRSGRRRKTVLGDDGRRRDRRRRRMQRRPHDAGGGDGRHVASGGGRAP